MGKSSGPDQAELVICDQPIDITYVPTGEGWVYRAVLMDVFTRRLLGWAVESSLEGGLTTTALDRALRRGTPGIHHSDQGVQYAAAGYVGRPVRRGCG